MSLGFVGSNNFCGSVVVYVIVNNKGGLVVILVTVAYVSSIRDSSLVVNALLVLVLGMVLKYFYRS